MTSCIRCGRAVPDGELFCAACGALPSEAEPARRGGKDFPAQKIPPRGGTKKTAPAPKAPKGLIVALVAAVLLAAVSLGALISQQLGARAQRAELRVREEALAAQENETQTLREERDELSGALAEAKLSLKARDDQISELQTSLSTAQNSANQSQYDMSTQQSELEQLRTDKAALEKSLTEEREALEALREEHEALQEEKDALCEERDTLKREKQTLTEKTSFMDAYVVFVEDDKTSLYHKYDCAAFRKKSFWAYSRKLAEKYGYSPCPDCFG